MKNNMENTVSKSDKNGRSKYFDYDENGRKKRKKIKKSHYKLGWIIFIIFLIFLAAFFLYMKETMNNKNFLQDWLNEHPEDISVSDSAESERSSEDSDIIDKLQDSGSSLSSDTSKQ